MNEPRSARLAPAPPPSRSPWQRFYAAVLAYRRANMPRHRLGRPTLSVGNLHWGGTGKTPAVIAIASFLHQRGHRLAILSRGYGRRSTGTVVVGCGNGPVVSVERAGDEPWLLAERLEGVSVLVDADRRAAARRALAELDPPPDLFLLDDAFSHVRVERDLDLLVFPFPDPWGGGRLLPSGRLREPLAATHSADAVLLTGLPSTVDAAAARSMSEELESALGRFGFAGPAFAARSVPLLVGDVRSPVLLVTGIARPERVVTSLAELGVEVAEHLRFPDHHRYPSASLERIDRARRRLGVPSVVTTAKDRVKLRGRLAEPTAEIDVELQPEEAFLHWLDDRLERLRSARVER